MNACPSCGEQYDDARKYCRKCGAALERPAEIPPLRPPPISWTPAKRKMAFRLAAAVSVIVLGAVAFNFVQGKLRQRAERSRFERETAQRTLELRQQLRTIVGQVMTCPAPLRGNWCDVSPSAVSSTVTPISWDGDQEPDLLLHAEFGGYGIVGVASSESASFEFVWAGPLLGGALAVSQSAAGPQEFQVEHSVCANSAWDSYGPAPCDPVPGVQESGSIRAVVAVTEPESLSCARPGCGSLLYARVNAQSWRVTPTGVYAGQTSRPLQEEASRRALWQGRVAARTLYVRSGPGRQYLRMSAVQTGDRVSILREVGVWLLAVLPDGTVGWLGKEWVLRSR